VLLIKYRLPISGHYRGRLSVPKVWAFMEFAVPCSGATLWWLAN
jgi:hypothetical protein